MLRRALRFALVLAGIVACSNREAPPAAAFLAVTQDSTFLIESDGAHIRARGSELLLAESEGRWVELYVADDDYSFFDALFVGQHVFRRDLLSGDSTELYSDT